MTDAKIEDAAYYNLEDGPRRVLVRHGRVKFVAPGLRLVRASAKEAEPYREHPKDSEPEDYGLPV